MSFRLPYGKACCGASLVVPGLAKLNIIKHNSHLQIEQIGAFVYFLLERKILLPPATIYLSLIWMHLDTIMRLDTSILETSNNGGREYLN
jgi:hypothetical protein